MPTHRRLSRWPAPSLPFVVLCMLLGVLWLAGGASRSDVWGQIVVRSAAWLALIVAIVFAKRPAGQAMGAAGWFLLAAIVLTVLQLVPLPPAVWQNLPGRDLFAEAAVASGQSQPWRPWSIVPGATANALSSLIVPVTILILLRALEPSEHARLPGLVLVLVFAATVIGLLQFSAGGLDNPFVNDSPGEVAGTFANRNHFALFVAIGCLIAPVWAFMREDQSQWRAPAALGLVLLFVLTILASGSRAGILLGTLAMALGLLIAHRRITRALRHYPRWVLPALVGGAVAMVVILVLVSIAADRAVSIQRMMAIDAGQDMRTRGLPTVLGMIAAYFPAGAGFGGFDPLFRIHEPLNVLKFTFFNHAHNDFLEIALDAGLAGLLLLSAAILWWAWASVGAWRARLEMHHAVPRLGSAILLLILVASAFDYPGRTPIIMAIIMIAATWLGTAGETSRGSALPQRDQHL